MARSHHNYLGIILTASTMLLTLACTHTYPGLDYDFTDPDENKNNEGLTKVPIEVFVNQQKFFSLNATRGTGAFDDLNETYEKISNAEFRVLAFRAGPEDVQNSVAKLTQSTNMQATMVEDSIDCLLDGSREGENSPRGIATSLTKDFSGAFDIQNPNKNSTEYGGNIGDSEYQYFYNSTYQTTGYNFFAYHVDDIAMSKEPKWSDDYSEMYYDIELDGSQDVMAGCAPIIDKQYVDSQRVKLNLNLNDSEISQVINIGTYSTYSAHLGILPIINMTHQLVRFKFLARPGAASAEGVRITGISITGPNTGRLVVASRNPNNPDAATATSPYCPVGFQPETAVTNELFLHEFCEDGVTPQELRPGEPERTGWLKNDSSYVMHWQEFPDLSRTEAIDNQTRTKIGESIMVGEASKYQMHIYYQFPVKDKDGNPTGEYDNLATVADLTPDKLGQNTVHQDEDGNVYYTFTPGYYYTLLITVYGREEIKVAFNVANWKDANSEDPIIVDPDSGDGTSHEYVVE